MEENQGIQLKLSKFKSNFRTDFSAGFLVFLLALPLSLGIAKASGFPASMGVLTAIIGGIFTLFFKVSELSIKGPAAGLITICAAAITEFGGGIIGWQTVCAVIVVMAIIQMLLGFLRLGGLSDFFPHVAVHGMLAAIGIIIIIKQIPVLLGVSPDVYGGKSIFDLIRAIPTFISNAHTKVATIGVLSLIVLFGLPFVKNRFSKKIPAPLIVLFIAMPLAILWNFKGNEPEHVLVVIGDFWGSLAINADFSSMFTFPFWKYVVMFLFVSSLESLLTVKAIDNLDPQKRQSNYNGDLIGQGAGNVVSGIFGGLPMISEVVRSSANIGYGARSKWSNFFHGIFLLIAMLFIIPLIELIPNTALAAMLIFAGYRLSAPKEFITTYKIGKEQLAIFVVTIVITLLKDLLIGIFAGILLKLIIHLFNGVRFANFFKVHLVILNKKNEVCIKLEKAAVFSNIVSFKKQTKDVKDSDKLVVDFSNSSYVDHSFLDFIFRYQTIQKSKNKEVNIIGLEKLRSFSTHPMSTKKA
ncbi:MAG: SulP family inorganic anion transporter [Lishizhenia sp.]